MNRPNQFGPEAGECDVSFEAYLGALLVLLCLLAATVLGVLALYQNVLTKPSAEHAVMTPFYTVLARGW